MAAEVRIPVKLELLQNSLSEIRSTIANLKPESTAWKELQNLLRSMVKEADSLQAAISKPFSSQKDFNAAEKSIKKVEDDLERASIVMGRIQFSDLKLDRSQSDALKDFEQQLKDIENRAKQFKATLKTELQSGVNWNDILTLDPNALTQSYDDIVKSIQSKVRQIEAESKKAIEALRVAQEEASRASITKQFFTASDPLSREAIGQDWDTFFQTNKNGELQFKSGQKSAFYEWMRENLTITPAQFEAIKNESVTKLKQWVQDFKVDQIINDEAKKQQNVKEASSRVAEVTAEAHKAQVVQEIIARNQARIDTNNQNLNTERSRITTNWDNYTAGATEAARASLQASAGMRQASTQCSMLSSALQHANSNWMQMDRAATTMNSLRNAVVNFMGFNQVLSLTRNAIRQAAQHIRELDSVMNKISIVTNMSTEDLWQQVRAYSDMAQTYGVSIKGAYEVSQIYYQQGLETADVLTLTNETLKLAKISGLDYAVTTDYMTTALRGFKMEMSEASTIVDVYSALAAHTAVSQEELAVAMSKTASSMESVGATFQDTSAMIGTMVAVTRESATNIGTALKSVASRYGELTKDPTALIDAEGEAMSFNKVDTALQSIGISMKTVDGQFRDFTDVIIELGEKWDQLDSTQQRYIATQFAGNRQQSRFLALVSNVDLLKSNMDVAMNSEDTGTLQALKALDSIESKTEQVRVAYQQFYTTMGAENVWKSALDGLKEYINMLNGLPKLFDKIPIGAIGMIMNLVELIRFAGTKLISGIAQIWNEALPSDIKINLSADKLIPDGKVAAEKSGQDVTAGMSQGMKAGEGEVRAAGVALGEAAIEGLRDGAGTHSPSVPAGETADNVGAGMINHLEAAIDAVKNAGRSLGEAAIAGVKEGMQNIQAVAALLVSQLAALAPEIQSKFGNLNNFSINNTRQFVERPEWDNTERAAAYTAIDIQKSTMETINLVNDINLINQKIQAYENLKQKQLEVQSITDKSSQEYKTASAERSAMAKELGTSWNVNSQAKIDELNQRREEILSQIKERIPSVELAVVLKLENTTDLQQQLENLGIKLNISPTLTPSQSTIQNEIDKYQRFLNLRADINSRKRNDPELGNLRSERDALAKELGIPITISTQVVQEKIAQLKAQIEQTKAEMPVTASTDAASQAIEEVREKAASVREEVQSTSIMPSKPATYTPHEDSIPNIEDRPFFVSRGEEQNQVNLINAQIDALYKLRDARLAVDNAAEHSAEKNAALDNYREQIENIKSIVNTDMFSKGLDWKTSVGQIDEVIGQYQERLSNFVITPTVKMEGEGEQLGFDLDLLGVPKITVDANATAEAVEKAKEEVQQAVSGEQLQMQFEIDPESEVNNYEQMYLDQLYEDFTQSNQDTAVAEKARIAAEEYKNLQANISGVIDELTKMGAMSQEAGEELKNSLKDAPIEELQNKFAQLNATKNLNFGRIEGLDTEAQKINEAAEAEQNYGNAIQRTIAFLKQKKSEGDAFGRNLSTIGSAMTTLTSVIDKSSEGGRTFAGVLTAAGGALKLISALSLKNPWMVIATGIVSVINGISMAIEDDSERLERLTKEAEEASNKSKEVKANLNILEKGKEKLEELEQKRYDSAEAAEEYQKQVDSLAEAFPQLIGGFDEAGNVILNTTNMENVLTAAREQSAAATLKAAEAEKKRTEEAVKQSKKDTLGEIDKVIDGLTDIEDIAKTEQGEDTRRDITYTDNWDTDNQNWLAAMGFKETSFLRMSADRYDSNWFKNALFSISGTKDYTSEDTISNLKNSYGFDYDILFKAAKNAKDEADLIVQYANRLQQQLAINKIVLGKDAGLGMGDDQMLRFLKQNFNLETGESLRDSNVNTQPAIQALQAFKTSLETGADVEEITNNYRQANEQITALTNSYWASQHEYQIGLLKDEVESLNKKARNYIDSTIENSVATLSIVSEMIAKQSFGRDFYTDNSKISSLIASYFAKQWEQKGSDYTQDDFNKEYGKSMTEAIDSADAFWTNLTSSGTKKKDQFVKMVDNIDDYRLGDFQIFNDLEGFEEIFKLLASTKWQRGLDVQENLRKFKDQQTTQVPDEWNKAIDYVQNADEGQYLKDIYSQYDKLQKLGLTDKAESYMKAALQVFNDSIGLSGDIRVALWTSIVKNGLETKEQIAKVRDTVLSNDTTDDDAIADALETMSNTMNDSVILAVEAASNDFVESWADSSKTLGKLTSGLELSEVQGIIDSDIGKSLELSMEDFETSGEKLILQGKRADEYITKFFEKKQGIYDMRSEELTEAIETLGLDKENPNLDNLDGKTLADLANEEGQQTLNAISTLLGSQDAIQNYYKDGTEKIDAEALLIALQEAYARGDTALATFQSYIDWAEAQINTSKQWAEGDYSSLDALAGGEGGANKAVLSFAEAPMRDWLLSISKDHPDLLRAVGQVQSTTSSLISDALSKGLNNLSALDYKALPINLDFSGSYVDFLNRYAKYTGKTVDEINDLYIQALAKDREQTSSSLLKDMIFVTSGTFKISESALNNLANAYDILAKDLITNAGLVFDENSEQYIGQVENVKNAGIDLKKINNYEDTVRDSISQYIGSIFDNAVAFIKSEDSSSSAKNFEVLRSSITDYYTATRGDETDQELQAGIEAALSNIAQGGLKAITTLSQIASASGTKLSDSQVESIYAASQNRLIAAQESLEKGVGTVLSGSAAVIARAAAGIEVQELPTGQVVITAVNDMVQAYELIYAELKYNANATTEQLNSTYAKLFSAQFQKNNNIEELLQNGGSMTADALGQILSQYQIKLEDVLTNMSGFGLETDIFGNIMITNWKQFVAGMSTKGLNISLNNPQWASIYSSYVDSIVELQNKPLESLTTATNQLKSITSAKIGQSINVSILEQKLGSSLQSIVEASGNTLENGILTITSNTDIPALVRDIAAAAAEAGALLPEQLAELADAVADMISSITKAITGGISGTLNNVDAQKLQTWAFDNGVGKLDFTQTTEGLKLSNKSAISLYRTLRKVDAVQGSIVFDTLNKSLSESNEHFKSLQSIQARIVELESMAPSDRKEEYAEELALAREIYAVRSATEDSSFNFMDQKIPSGQNNPLNYWKSWGQAFDIIKEAATGDNAGFMTYENFYNLVTEIGNLAQLSELPVNFGGEMLANSEQAADLITKAAGALSNVDGNLMVNLGDIGIDFSSGVDGMADNIDAGIDALAQSQIDMLDGMIKLLETMKAMEDLSDVDADIDMNIDFEEVFETDSNGDITAYTKAFDDWRNGLLKQIEGYNSDPSLNKALDKDLAEAMHSVRLNGISFAELLDWNASAWNGQEELRDNFLQSLTAFYQAALSDDWNLDDIGASLSEILKKGGAKGISVDVGDSTFFFEGDFQYKINWKELKESGIEDSIREGAAEYLDITNDTSIQQIIGQLIEKRGDINLKIEDQATIDYLLKLANGEITIKEPNEDNDNKYVGSYHGMTFSNDDKEAVEKKIHEALELENQGFVLKEIDGKISGRLTLGSAVIQVVETEKGIRYLASDGTEFDDYPSCLRYTVSQGFGDASMAGQQYEYEGYTYQVKYNSQLNTVYAVNIKTGEIEYQGHTFTNESEFLAFVQETEPIIKSGNYNYESKNGFEVWSNEKGTIERNITTNEILYVASDGTKFTSAAEYSSYILALELKEKDAESGAVVVQGEGQNFQFSYLGNTVTVNYDANGKVIYGIDFGEYGSVTSSTLDGLNLAISDLGKAFTPKGGDLSDASGGEGVAYTYHKGDVTLDVSYDGKVTVTGGGQAATAVQTEIQNEVNKSRTPVKVKNVEADASEATVTVTPPAEGWKLSEVIPEIVGTATRLVIKALEVVTNTDNAGETESEDTKDDSSTVTITYESVGAEEAAAAAEKVTEAAQAADDIDPVVHTEAPEAGSVIMTIRTLAAAISSIPPSKTVNIALNLPEDYSSRLDSFIDKIKSVAKEWKVTFKAEKSGNWPSDVSGTPFVSGNVGNAMAGGNTLMGELGPELVVQQGRYFVVGQQGAEFVNLAPDAIVFNHLQTEQLLKNGMSSERGRAVTNERVAAAYAHGSMNGGPAMASIGSAITTLKQLRSMWQSLLQASVKDLAGIGGGGGGGGGGGNNGGDPKAFIHQLEQWYNWLQKIAELEEKINYEETKRSKIQSDMIPHGQDITKSYLESLDALKDQVGVEKSLVDSQQEYFDKRRKELNTNGPFNSLYTFDEQGQLQYQDGAFEKISAIFESDKYGKPLKTVEEQYNAIQALGIDPRYYAQDSSGNPIKAPEEPKKTAEQIKAENAQNEGETDEEYEKRVQGLLDSQNSEWDEYYANISQAFWDRIEADREEMQSLHDSIEEHKVALLEAQTAQNEILQAIEDNQIAVEGKVLKAVEDSRQREIDDAKDERDAIEKASDNLINGLSTQLQNERNMYERKQSNEELSKLQRQLGILQRSGGSASSIASLESQIADKMQSAYFDAQQDEIDKLQEASDNQLKKLDEQINLMKETLEYEKEHGLLWNDVYQIMAGSPEDIANYIKTNDSDYWAKSPTELTKQTREDLNQSQQLDALKKEGESIESLIEKYSKEEAAADDSAEEEPTSEPDRPGKKPKKEKKVTDSQSTDTSETSDVVGADGTENLLAIIILAPSFFRPLDGYMILSDIGK